LDDDQERDHRGGNPSKYPAGNFFPADPAALSFAILPAQRRRYHLISTSAYKNAGRTEKTSARM